MSIYLRTVETSDFFSSNANLLPYLDLQNSKIVATPPTLFCFSKCAYYTAVKKVLNIICIQVQ